MASVAKVLITFENECIPANLNLKKIKPEIAEMCPPLNPVIVNTPYVPGIYAFDLKKFFHQTLTHMFIPGNELKKLVFFQKKKEKKNSAKGLLYLINDNEF